MFEKRRATLAILLLAAWMAPTARGDEPTKGEPPPRTRPELEARLLTIMKEGHIPGLGLAVVGPDESRTWSTGLGLADVASGRPATADTLFRIGSITKNFVALAVLMLAEEGRLNLDDEVKRLVPDVAFHNPWEATDPVRVAHLLEHTTGFDDIALREYALDAPDSMTLRQGLAYHPASRSSRWRPGSRMSYCNSGPALAAAIVERLTGRRFEDFVGERIFTPLGMSGATFFQPDAARAATLYRADGATPYPYWRVLMRPAGSVNASAAEMARYTRLLLGRGTLDGTTLVKAASIERMERPATALAARAGLSTGYALGNYTTVREDGFTWHGHNGGVEGGLATLQYLPEHGVGLVVLINSGNVSAASSIEKLVKAFAVRDLTKPEPPPVARVPAEVQAAFTGYWIPASPRQERLRFVSDILGLEHMQVTAEGLVARPLLGKALHFAAVSERTFRKHDRAAATLVLIDDAREGRLIQSGGTTYAPISAARFWGQAAVSALCAPSMLGAPLFALVWLPRAAWRRLRGHVPLPGLALRAWPVAAVLALAAAFALPIVRGDDLIQSFGHPTPWSWSFTGATLLFGLLSLLGLWLTWRPAPGVGRGALWQARLTSAANAVAALYLVGQGFLGWRPWT
jgi:CubicO group peptidase (beta-lactamase class C family)